MNIAPDELGGLSIVVQGPIDRTNAEVIATSLARWRAIYPSAQIICAISTAEGSGDDAIAAAIARTCNRWVWAPAAAILSPIKTDSVGPNHVNLQIAAARAGLALATGRHVLRVRNDLTFLDRRLLEVHAKAQLLPRGGRALFAERIVASQLFTLNPLTAQRMPFHVSDWFHLGLTSDVRRLWDAAVPATPESATWYRDHPHVPGSNAAERRFLTRLASEQRITFPVFAAAFPDLTLDHHNDSSSAAASLCVVAENFALADMAGCGARLPKYQREIDRMSAFTRLECLSQEQLERIVAHPDRSVLAIFQPEIAAIARHNGPIARLRRSARRWSRRMARRFSASAAAFGAPDNATHRS